jgi:hypothetical protein
MKSTYSRRYRRSPSRSRESAAFKKDSQHEHAFFAGPSEQGFFKPDGVVHRKCDHGEAEDKMPKKRWEQIKLGERAAKDRMKLNIAAHFQKVSDAITSFKAYAERISNSVNYLTSSIYGLTISILNALKGLGGVAPGGGLLPLFIGNSLNMISIAALQDGAPEHASMDSKIKVFLNKLEETTKAKFSGGINDLQKQIDSSDFVLKFQNPVDPERTYKVFERAGEADLKLISNWAGIPDPADFSLFNQLYESLLEQFNTWLASEVYNYWRSKMNAIAGDATDMIAEDSIPARGKGVETASKDSMKETTTKTNDRHKTNIIKK